VPAGDVQLLNAWKDGDQDAGEELFERHYDSVSRFFANKVTLGVDDLIQNTFMACLEAKERIREGSNFRAYLFGVARHLLYASYRQYRQDGERFDFNAVSAVDIAPGAGSVLVQREEEQLFLFALRNIPVEHQILLEMYYWESQRASEIAALLDIPEGTVRTRLRRAKSLLENALAKQAQSPALLQSTCSNLEKWALAIRERELNARD
jgi:RNA polymerase sigma-70 factor (ECF subfamily)